MFKKFKRLSRKRQIFTVLISVIIVALVAALLYQTFKPEPRPEYQVQAASVGDIQATFDTKGTVESTSTEKFTAAAGVKVSSVNVAVGDRVKAGDVLATFDVSSIDGTLANYKSAFGKAKAAYDKASGTVSSAKSGIKAIDLQISQTESDISALKREIAATHNADIKNAENAKKYTEEQLEALREQLKNGGLTEEEIQDIINSLKNSSGDVDIEKALSDSVAAKQMKLAQAEAQLTSLKTQRAVYEAQTDETVSDIYKSVMEQKQKDYESYKAIYDSLKNGWVASADGIITTVNIEAGKEFTPAEAGSSGVDLSSIISSMTSNSEVASTLTDILSSTAGSASSVGDGIVLENYGEFIASFTVGKYDLLGLKVGQSAVVSTLGSDYDAVVSYVGATASENNGLNISSIASSFTGSSSNSASAVAKVKILNPDEKIVIGFDVDIKVNTEKITNVLKIPVDAVATDDAVTYVYVYNPDKKTVEKRTVELGVFSDDDYEVKSGLSEGELVVMNPKAALTDGTKIAVKG